MKTRTISNLFLAALTALFFSACGNGSETEVTAPPAAEAPAAQESAPAAESSDSAEADAPAESGKITITGNDQMKFDTTEFSVKAGEEVTIVFENIGKLPKEAMGHNLLVLKKEVDPIRFAAASATAADNDYIAPDREDEVIAGTKILGPGESETITFTAPEETGDFPFVCTFPGHASAGMSGVMKVV